VSRPDFLNGVNPHRLSEHERAERRERILATRPAGEAFWVFGFGSLMWRPEFEPVERQAATLSGYERHFRIISTTARGTPERPGLAPCLEEVEGGQCLGIVFRLDEARVADDLVALWDREQNSGSYNPTWVELKTHEGPLTALTFVVERDHPHYLGPLSIEDTASAICGAEGRHGACRDYVASLVGALRELGERDPFLEDLLARVDGLSARP